MLFEVFSNEKSFHGKKFSVGEESFRDKLFFLKKLGFEEIIKGVFGHLFKQLGREVF